MSTFSWIGEVDELSPAALTVRAQAVSPNDNGTLLWDIFFPRRDRNSVDLDDVTTLDERPAADRREWNARGRYVPPRVPERRKVSIVPIEAYDKIEEYEMQKINEQTLGEESRIREIVGVSIPRRIDRLAMSVYRRLEIDAMNVWANGAIVQRNPQTGATYSASFGFDAGRLLTAGTAWNDGGVNAYDLLVDFYEDAVDASGAGAGVMLRRATLAVVLADAPTLLNGAPLNRMQLEDDISQRTGQAFRFYVNENSVDVYDDGGTAYTRTKTWPAQHVAFVPAGQGVGNTEAAPVARAMQMARQVPQASIDVRGVTAFLEESNGGRELAMECQANLVPVPDENKLMVIDAGV